MRIKIQSGTPSSSEANLCVTCAHARITRGHRLDEELVICRASHLRDERIPFKVTTCSAYADERYLGAAAAGVDPAARRA